MIVAVGLRASVERLMRGEYRQQDINDLFFALRAERGGRGLVSEIAHFIAHPDTRDQGITTTNLRDQMAFLKFRMPWGKSGIIPSDLPSIAPSALRGNLRRMRKNVLKRHTGMNLVHAERVLERILARMLPTGGGVSKPRINNHEELSLFTLLATYSTGGPVFTDEDLFSDLIFALKKEKLLDANEQAALDKAKPAITIFSLIAMHNVAVDLGDGSKALISIVRDRYGNLGSFAFTEVAKAKDGLPFEAGGWVLKTALSIDQYCQPGIAPPYQERMIGDFEMNGEPRLVHSP